MPLPEAIGPETAATPRWLSIVGIGEDGIDGLSATARGLIEAAEIVFGGRRHLTLAAPLIRGAARPWPSPFDGAAEEVLAPSRAAGLRAGVRRSVPLRRRRGAGAARRSARNDRAAGAVRLQPRGRAARLVAAGDRVVVVAWPRARSHPSAFATRGTNSGADVRRRRTGGFGETSGRERFRRVAFDCSRTPRRSATNRSAARPPPLSTLARSDRSIRWRSRSKPRRTRA